MYATVCKVLCTSRVLFVMCMYYVYIRICLYILTCRTVCLKTETEWQLRYISTLNANSELKTLCLMRTKICSAHIHTRTLSLSHTHTHTRNHAHTDTHTHTHTIYTHTHTHTHIHTHTGIVAWVHVSFTYLPQGKRRNQQVCEYINACMYMYPQMQFNVHVDTLSFEIILSYVYICSCKQHSAPAFSAAVTRYITLQHSATLCNTLQHAATHWNTLQSASTSTAAATCGNVICRK